MGKWEITGYNDDGAHYIIEDNDANYSFTPFTIGASNTVSSITVEIDGLGHSSSSFYCELCVRIVYSDEGMDDIVILPCSISRGVYTTTYSATNSSLSEKKKKKICSKELAGISAYVSDGRSPRALSTSTCKLIIETTTPSITKPGKPVIAQVGDYFNISWAPSTIVNGSGTIVYTVIEGHEGEPVGDSTTNTQIQIPLFYPVEVAYEGEGARFFVVATCEALDLEATSDTTSWDPQHVLYYYTGTKWQQCELFYFDGTAFRPCRISYFNGTMWAG